MRDRKTLAEEPDDTLALVEQMSSLLFFCERWHARARGKEEYYQHATARGAMRLALGLDKLAEEAQAIRRARVPVTPSRASRRQRSLLDDEE